MALHQGKKHKLEDVEVIRGLFRSTNKREYAMGFEWNPESTRCKFETHIKDDDLNHLGQQN